MAQAVHKPIVARLYSAISARLAALEERLSLDEQNRRLAQANFDPVAFSVFTVVALERGSAAGIADAAPARIEKNVGSSVEAGSKPYLREGLTIERSSQ